MQKRPVNTEQTLGVAYPGPVPQFLTDLPITYLVRCTEVVAYPQCSFIGRWDIQLYNYND